MNKKPLIFATGNMHKLEEVNQILQGTSFQAIAMSEYGITEDIPETGDTMAENALQKATYLKDKLGKDCFAEDSGLEIEALDMAPGIYTARYAGPQRSNLDNMQRVLQELEGKSDRKAQFRAVIALILGDKQFFFEGIVRGRISMEMIGEGGFGYDPIFIPEAHNQTFAALDPSVKLKISHRAEAVKKLAQFLSSN